MKPKTKEVIGIQDAMDNLASIANIDKSNPSPIGIVKKHRLVTTEEEFGKDTVEWVSGEGPGTILAILDLTYRTIHQHLMKLCEDPEMNWENVKSRQGIAAMMDLVGESASKMDFFFKFWLGKEYRGSVAEGGEFQALQRFYTNQIVPRFAGEKQIWAEDWEKNPESELLDLSRTGLKDFETVKKDAEYELFYIRNEEGRPYFNAALLRNIKLSCDFDLVGEEFEEDPLLKIRAMQDRDLHASAAQILNACHPAIVDFYKMAHQLEGNECAHSIGMGLIALFLAANPRYLLQNTVGKSCLQYFEDFHTFLQRALKTTEYQKWIAYPPDASDKQAHLLLYLIHSLAREFFMRVGGVKQEAIGLIHRTMRRGEEIKQKKGESLAKGETVWNQFLLDDEKYRTLLQKFPNGPLFKTLDLIREAEEGNIEIPFDPIAEGDLPSKLYDIRHTNKRIEVLRLPSPTRQWFINKVEVVETFRAFLRSFTQEKVAHKHLLINVQDRTSWKEFARTKALETLQMQAEFNHVLVVMTLPKSTDFYYQAQEYLALNSTDEFMKALKEQWKDPEACGYFLPSSLQKTELTRFVESILPIIHQFFFHGKNTLTRRAREDFIEIFYQFLILKCIDMIHPTSMSFTCKDAIDTGAASVGLFYGFLQRLAGNKMGKEEADFLRYLLYTPALFIRERAIDPERLSRILSALERIDSSIEGEGKQLLKAVTPLYSSKLFSDLSIV